MKLSVNFSILIVLVMVCCTSCKKYLSEKSDKRLVELSTLQDLQALLDYRNTMNSNTPDFGETSSDDHFVTPDIYASLDDRGKQSYIWNLKEYNFQNDWSFAYSAIYNANYCLDYIDKVPTAQQNTGEWNNVKGSAYFYRAFWYLNLAWVFTKAYDEESSSTDAGLVLRLTSDPSIASRRSTVNESYAKILQDAKNSIGLLPELPRHVMRPSKRAAYALLARTYLSMRYYDSAYKYANLSLQQYNYLIDYNDISQVDKSSFVPFLEPFNKEIIFFSSQSNNYASKVPFLGSIDTLLYASYAANDLRKSVFFTTDFGYPLFKGNYNSNDFYSFFSGLATDEMYLTRAECLARKGKVTEAMADLNSLLEKRWVTGTFTPYDSDNSTAALEIILTERRKELLMRGIRWADIKRLNKEGASITLIRSLDKAYTLPPNSDKFALAIPLDIIQLTGIKQNPGWQN